MATIQIEPRVVRILSIDGGGIRGIMPARVLEEIEGRVGKKSADIFHMIAGTSTGGIIGCGLLVGKSPKSLGDLYATRGGEIFHRSLWKKVANPAELDGPKYDPTVLEQILGEQLGEVWLGETIGVELLVPTYVIELPTEQQMTPSGLKTTRCPYFFKSWKARGTMLDRGDVQNALDFRLRDIARATSAAPTYFPPAQIENRLTQKFGAVDGGVFANNPAMSALAAAYRRFPNATSYLLVSLGTGSLERAIPYDEAAGWGDFGWLHPILSILMDGNADTVCYECDQELGTNHYRFDITLGTDPHADDSVNEDFDDASADNVKRLERLSQRLIREQSAKLDQLCTLLKPEKCVSDLLYSSALSIS
jgi:uncharacterized protein